MTQGKKTEADIALTAATVIFVIVPLVNLALLDRRSWPYWLWLLGGVLVVLTVSSLQDHFKPR